MLYSPFFVFYSLQKLRIHVWIHDRMKLLFRWSDFIAPLPPFPCIFQYTFPAKESTMVNLIIIRCVFFSLSIGRESTTWHANNCLQIIVYSCVVPSERVLLRIIFCSCVIGTTFSREKGQIASLSCQKVIKIWKQSWWSNDKTII